MLRCKRHTATGQKLPDLYLDLSPTEAGMRLFKKFGAIAKSQGIADSDQNFGLALGKIDAGQIDLGTLMRLFTGPEIIRAIHGRLSQVQPGSDEYKDLMAMLHDPNGWRTAVGGQDAPDRFGVKRYDAPGGSRRDTCGGGAGRGDSGDPEGKGKISKSLQKSMEHQGRLDECKAAGLRVHSGDCDPNVMIHPKRPGAGELHLRASGDWEHRRRGKLLASGGAAQLRGRLAMFSKDHDED